MFVVDSADYPPVTFSVGLPSGIQLSQLSDPWNVHEAMMAPDADGWKDTMAEEMANFRSMPGMRTCVWAGFFTRSSKTAIHSWK